MLFAAAGTAGAAGGEGCEGCVVAFIGQFDLMATRASLHGAVEPPTEQIPVDGHQKQVQVDVHAAHESRLLHSEAAAAVG